jgi:hypothetical protein
MDETRIANKIMYKFLIGIFRPLIINIIIYSVFLFYVMSYNDYILKSIIIKFSIFNLVKSSIFIILTYIALFKHKNMKVINFMEIMDALDNILINIFTIILGIIIFASSQEYRNEDKGLWWWGIVLFVLLVLNKIRIPIQK